MDITTLDAVEDFIRSRRAAGAAKSYVDWLRHMLRHLPHGSLPATPAEVEDVLQRVRASTVSPATYYDVWVAMATLFNWTARRFEHPNPFALLKKPRLLPRPLPAFSPAEVNRLLLKVRPRPRENALIMLLLDTGARIGEAHGLTWDDIGPDYVLLDGKTGAREVPITPDTSRALRRLGGTRHLWHGSQGPLTLDGLKRVARRALQSAGLNGGPHKLRHTFGRLYVLNGGDLFSLQRIMGHQNIQTTRRYLELDMRDVARQHARFSPVARTRGAFQLELVDHHQAARDA